MQNKENLILLEQGGLTGLTIEEVAIESRLGIHGAGPVKNLGSCKGVSGQLSLRRHDCLMSVSFYISTVR